MPPPRPLVRPARRFLSTHRRLLAALCAAVAAGAAVDVVAPPPVPVQRVVAAARDLAAGTSLRAEDLTELELPVGVVPDGVLRTGAAIGRTVAGPVRRGEPLTDARLVGPALLAGLSSQSQFVAVPVRLADPDAVRLVRPGDRIDVLAAPLESGAAGADGSVVVVASAALVLATPAVSPADDGSLLLVAVSSETARSLARAANSARLSLALRPPR